MEIIHSEKTVDKNWSMDHSPIRQSFEFGKSISTAGKSILNFIQLSSLVAKYCKMWKIWPRKVCEFCILLYYARKSVITVWKCGNAFSRVIQKYTKFANFTLLYNCAKLVFKFKSLSNWGMVHYRIIIVFALLVQALFYIPNYRGSWYTHIINVYYTNNTL